jgi:glycosyltransferase involved in cell wall biosynthesis
MITDNPFLSICIPTYNRVHKTLSLVTSILEYDDVDIEVVVLDNCSSDNTEIVLSNIKF